MVGGIKVPDGGLAVPSARITRDLPMAERLIVALDVPTIPQAHALVNDLGSCISFFKLGFRLQMEPDYGGLIDRLITSGKRVFLDAKMYDIPETVGPAIAAAARRKIDFITVHGDEMIMRAAVEAKGSTNIKIFAVTVLTSLDDDDLRRMGYRLGAKDLVRLRASLAVKCGCDGIIASADDDPDSIRELAEMPSLLIATPGVRQAHGDKQDQKRITTPGQAIQSGADYLVVGRPIIAKNNPLLAAKSFIDEMESARPESK